MIPNFFVKSHGLGNEYIVLDKENIQFELTPKAIKILCNIHFGIGSDGVLLKVPSNKAQFGFKVYNPDASEAEKSGNGLRIFAKYLYDYGFTTNKIFTIETLGGIVTAEILEVKNQKATIVKIDLGKATFLSKEIPVSSEKEEFIGQTILADDKTYVVNCVSVGNPHCVIIKENLDKNEILKYGKFLEKHKLFPNNINVQFAKPISKTEIEILIWERGAEYTLASGSSSSAVACICKKLGLTDNDVTMKMEGGELKISLDEDYNIKLTGEVKEVASGILSNELLEDF
ncbi:MAG: diaminopimelate epimerase [Bacteroidales bacterium]|nr:diaminopimelate epimerase [Bacteroidales bacterium]